MEFKSNILATGTITGSNLSGTNTGDQDLSGYALDDHNHDPDYVSITGDTMTGVLTVSKSGTMIASNYMSDAIGWNTNYGVYIGSNVGGTHYLRGNGTFTTGGSTYNLWHAGNLTNVSQLTNDAGYLTSLPSHNHDDRYYTKTESDGRFVNVAGDTMTGTLTIDTGSSSSDALVLKGTSPTISFLDDDGGDDFYIHVNSNNFYVLANRDANDTVGTGWEAPHPLQIEADTNIGYLFGSRMFADNYHPNADKWTTARTLSLTGDVSGSVSWDGSANASLSVSVNNDSHTHSKVYIPDTRGSARLPNYYDDRYAQYDFQNTSDTGAGGDSWHVLQTISPWSVYNNAHRQQQLAWTGSGGLKFRYATSETAWAGWQTLWTSGNDGSGSGLDADTLDGQHASDFQAAGNYQPAGSYVTTNTTQTVSGAKTFSSGSNRYNGHLYYDPWDANGNHYPHFTDGSNANGVNVNWRLYNGSSLITHTWNYTDTNFVNSLRSTVDLRAPSFYDLDNTSYYVNPSSTGTSLNVRGEITNPSIWINDGDNVNNYNENIRLFNASNGVSVIAFGATGTGGIPTSSALGYSDRHEIRIGNTWRTRTYGGYFQVNGDARATRFYDSNDTAYYLDPASTSNLNGLTVNGTITGTTSGNLTNASSEHLTYVHRIHTSDGTSPDNFGYNNRYQTFNYGVSSGVTGPLLSFGALGDNYPMQITGAYSGGGSLFKVRTRNGDAATWNAWRTLWHDGNFNPSSYLTTTGKAADSDLLDGVQGASFLRSDATDSFSGNITFSSYLISNARDKGLFGVYDSTKTDQIWSMGTAYRNHSAGTNFGNLYGLAYKHTNNTTGGTMGGSHQMVWCNNGSPRGSIGYNAVWHAESMKAPIYYDSGNTAYYGDFASNSRYNTAQGNYLGLGVAANTSGSYRLNMGGNIDMNNNGIDYTSQLHFNSNVRFYQDSNDSYLNFKYGDASTGGIKFLNGGGSLKGYLYATDDGFGLLDNDGQWAVKTRTGTDPLTLYCDNNEEFRVYTSYTLSLGSSRAPIFYDSNNTAYYLDPSSTSVSAKLAGSVGIGTTSPGSKLEVVGNTSSALLTLKSSDGGANDSFMRFYDESNGPSYSVGLDSSDEKFKIAYDTDGDSLTTGTRLVIDNSGKVGIGTTSPGQKLDVAGNIECSSLYLNNASSLYFLPTYFGQRIKANCQGLLVQNGSTYQAVYASAFSVQSDYRLKSNVVPLDNAIDRLKQMSVHRFNWNDRLDEPKVDGFIAHELSEVIPEAVLGEKDATKEDGTPDYQGIDQSKIVPLLTAALQDAITKIEQLETRIQTLENNN
jgi:hypothetical protein